MRGRIVPEFQHARMPVQRRLHHAALHAAPAAVYQAHLSKASRRGGFDVFLDDRYDVGRRKRVQIDLGFDWDLERHNLQSQRSRYSAVTLVLIPPRIEKSPTTVMRRG
jgi:hypothetical protein